MDDSSATANFNSRRRGFVILFDFGVVGSGIAGLMFAQEAVNNGFSVGVVSSKKNSPASAAAVGMSAIKGVQDPRDPFFASKIQGHDDFAHILCDLQSTFSGQIWQMGVWELFADKKSYQAICERIYHRKWRGHKDVLTLKRKDLLASSLPAEAMHATESLGGLFYPRDYSFSPFQVLNALKTSLKSRGVSFFDMDVHKVDASEAFSLEGSLKVKHLVLAAGASTPQLLVNSGYEFNRDVLWKTTPGITYETSWKGPQGAIKWGQSGLVASGQILRFGSDDAEVGSPDSWCEKINNFYCIGVPPDSVQIHKGVRLRAQGRKPVVEAAYHEKKPPIWVLSGFHRNGYTLAVEASKRLFNKIIEYQ
ncbi:MAG: FAD-dependent oxidoreductase [Oligoflexales bacterium]